MTPVFRNIYQVKAKNFFTSTNNPIESHSKGHSSLDFFFSSSTFAF